MVVRRVPVARLIAIVGLTGGLIASPAPAVGSTVQMSATQMFALADQARLQGDATLAETIYRAMFADVSMDIRLEARFRLAMIQSKSGNLAQAAVLLREVVDARPSAVPARLELAGILDKMGDRDGAWRQLRAIRASGLPPQVARIIDRYSQALRAQRPFGASLEIAIAPDSNINRATRSDTLGTVLGDFEISQEGKAKSGTGLSVTGQAYRRLPLGSDASLLMRVTAFANLYREKQFNDIAADAAAGPEFNLGRNRLQVEVGATQRWFGQKPFMRSARLAGTFTHPFGGQTLVRVTGSASLVDNQMNDLQDGKTYSGQLGVEHALTPVMGLSATVAMDRQSARDPGYATTGSRASLSGWRDFGRVTVTAGVDIARLHADQRLTLFPKKRSDRYARLSLGATFRQLHWSGFAPVARFSIERNRSSIAFYDYRRTRTEMGIVRAF